MELDISGLDRARKNVPNGLRRWLEELVWGRAAKDKFVPDAVFRPPRRAGAAQPLFRDRRMGDGPGQRSGSAWLLYGQRGACQAGAQHLPLRFGVVAALCDRSVRYGEARRQAFQLNITEPGSIRAFVDGIGIFGKDAAIGRVARALEGRRRHANRDLIPREAWKLIDMARGESWASLSRRMGFGQGHNLHVGTRALSRHRMSRFADALEDQRRGTSPKATCTGTRS